MNDNRTTSFGSGECKDGQRPAADASRWLDELVDQARAQTRLLTELRGAAALDACLLEKIARILCLTANETHRSRLQLDAIAGSVDALLELARAARPAEALQLERLAALKLQLQACCPDTVEVEPICRYEPCAPNGGIRVGDGSSVKSRARVEQAILNPAGICSR